MVISIFADFFFEYKFSFLYGIVHYIHNQISHFATFGSDRHLLGVIGSAHCPKTTDFGRLCSILIENSCNSMVAPIFADLFKSIFSFFYMGLCITYTKKLNMLRRSLPVNIILLSTNYGFRHVMFNFT